MSEGVQQALVMGVCTILAAIVSGLVALPLVNWRLKANEDKVKDLDGQTEKIQSIETQIAVMKVQMDMLVESNKRIEARLNADHS